MANSLGCGTSSSCRYSSTVRNCYFKRCGLHGDPMPDCYGPGELHCQHGSVECFGNRIEACAKLYDSESTSFLEALHVLVALVGLSLK